MRLVSKLPATAVLSLLPFFVSAQVIGIWIQDVDDDPLTLILEEDGSATIILGDDIFGGLDYETNRGMATMKYRTESAGDLQRLTITMTLQSNGEVLLTYYGLFRILGDGRMQLALYPEEEGFPDELTDDNSMWLTNYD